MKERPIPFVDPMVRAILDGTKTQMRRLIKPQPPKEFEPYPEYGGCCPFSNGRYGFVDEQGRDYFCPYGQPGDSLWVRETFADCGVGYEPVYRASTDVNFIWTPSVQMPRKYSRITLEIEFIRAEPLQNMGDEEAIAEGVMSMVAAITTNEPPMSRFIRLWNGIIIKPREHYWASWKANPWVWVVGFRRVKP